ncbi:hypothetical protein ACWGQ5_13480 [Streptomyces sp. NPDC055722]
MAGTVTNSGSVMKLGKALATGVAEEHPEPYEEEAGLEAVEALEELETSAAEEVPVAR